MLISARIFVFFIFAALGTSFIAETVLLAREFADSGWFIYATHDSHLFIFFPTLGLVALAAFYLPSCAFVDLYWRHVKLGKLRFFVGFAVLAALSYWIAGVLTDSPDRSVWDLSPQTIASDKSEPVGCGSAQRPCERIALAEGIRNVARVSNARLGLREFIRTCTVEPLLEAEPLSERKRFCFASTPLTEAPHLSSDTECCRAQQRFQQAITRYYASPGNRSQVSLAHDMLLPFKVFLLLVLLVISILLAVRHDGVTRHYPDHIGRIEIGVLVGALAMVFFPLMSQAFVQTTDALYGMHQEAGFKPIVNFMSFAFGAWALLLALFFFRRHNPEVELAVKLAGVVASTVAVVKFDLIVDLFVRFLGSGADEVSIGALVVLAILAVVFLLSPLARRTLIGADKHPVP